MSSNRFVTLRTMLRTLWLGLRPKIDGYDKAENIPELCKAHAATKELHRNSVMIRRDLRLGELARLQDRLERDARPKNRH